MHERFLLTGEIAVALMVTAIHLGAHRFQHWALARVQTVGSFGNGMAVSFVFLDLLRNLDESHHVIGERIYFLVLLGFLAYYSLERFRERLLRHSGKKGPQFSLALWIGQRWIYSWLLVYVAPVELLGEDSSILVVLVAIGLHVMEDDLDIQAEFREYLAHRGRFILATAPVTAWLTDELILSPTPLLNNLMTALLAGSMLFNTLGDEDLRSHRLMYHWFLAGVFVYLGLHVLSLA